MGVRRGIFSCIRFGKFSLFVLKMVDLEVVDNFYPLPCSRVKCFPGDGYLVIFRVVEVAQSVQ